jgi:hypothetical protein
MHCIPEAKGHCFLAKAHANDSGTSCKSRCMWHDIQACFMCMSMKAMYHARWS